MSTEQTSSSSSSTNNNKGTTGWYFAFGSNLNVDRLYEARLKPRNNWMGRRLAGKLDNWQLKFNIPSPAFIGTGVGNIVQKDGASVWGTLNEIDQDGFETLDIYEQVKEGMYKRVTVNVFCPALDKTVEATAYVACCKLDDTLIPSKAYLAHFLAGRDVLPKEYVAELEKIPTADVQPDPNHLQK